MTGTTTSRLRIAAGYRIIFYGVNVDGYVIGNTEDGATAGDTDGSPMRRWRGAMTAPLLAGEDEIVAIQGDDEQQGQFEFEGDLPVGTITSAVRDLDAEAVFQGTNVVTEEGLLIGVEQPSGKSAPTIGLLLQRRAKKQDPGVVGSKAWEIKHIPVCTITPLGSEYAQRTGAEYNYSVNVSKADAFAWGATFTEAAHGFTQAGILPILSDNPIHVHAFLGDGAQTDFTLEYNIKAGTTASVFVNRIKQASGVTASGDTVVFSVAPASDAQIQVLYEFDEGEL